MPRKPRVHRSMHYSSSSIPGVVHPRHSYIHVHHIPGVPAHIVQRGNNREACFFSDDDYQYYLEVLRQDKKRVR